MLQSGFFCASCRCRQGARDCGRRSYALFLLTADRLVLSCSFSSPSLISCFARCDTPFAFLKYGIPSARSMVVSSFFFRRDLHRRARCISTIQTWKCGNRPLRGCSQAEKANVPWHKKSGAHCERRPAGLPSSDHSCGVSCVFFARPVSRLSMMVMTRPLMLFSVVR